MKSACWPARWVIAAVLAAVPVWSGAQGQKKTVFLASPRYTVDIGFELTGRCNPYQGSNWKRLDLYSTFKSLRFVPTRSTDEPFWIESAPGSAAGGIATHQLQGHGEIRGFSLCPAWESDDDPIAATVIRGPAPFAPALTVLSAEEASELLTGADDPIPLVPLVPVVWLQYRTAFSVQGKELAWAHRGLSTNQIEDFSVVFSVSIEGLGKGKFISLQVPHSGESQSGTWSITLSPLAQK